MRLNRRRHPRRRSHGMRSGTGASGLRGFILIVALAVIAGYFTTQLLIFPALGMESSVDNNLWDKGKSYVDSVMKKDWFDSDKNILDFFKKDKDRDSDEEKLKPDNDNEEKILEDGLTGLALEVYSEGGTEVKVQTGYAVQFGCFESAEAAGHQSRLLKADDIDNETLKTNDTYKVVGHVYQSKEEARSALEKVDKNKYSGAFVTEIK